jgi:hypothetical protein
LLGVGDVHNDAALQHFGQACFQAQAGGSSVVIRHKSSFLVELIGVPEIRRRHPVLFTATRSAWTVQAECTDPSLRSG